MKSKWLVSELTSGSDSPSIFALETSFCLLNGGVERRVDWNSLNYSLQVFKIFSRIMEGNFRPDLWWKLLPNCNVARAKIMTAPALIKIYKLLALPRQTLSIEQNFLQFPVVHGWWEKRNLALSRKLGKMCKIFASQREKLFWNLNAQSVWKAMENIYEIFSASENSFRRLWEMLFFFAVQVRILCGAWCDQIQCLSSHTLTKNFNLYSPGIFSKTFSQQQLKLYSHSCQKLPHSHEL